MDELPNYFYSKMAALLEHQPKNISYLLKNCFIVGSTIAYKIINLENDNDIDIFYYENGKKAKNNMKKLHRMLSANYLDESLDIDMLSWLITDKFLNKENKSLTYHIFDEKKELFSRRVGIFRAINYKGFFLTKIATKCCRDEKRDDNAINAVLNLWDNGIPKEVEFAIEEYGLTPYYEEFK